MEENTDARLTRLEEELASLREYVTILARDLTAMEQEFAAYQWETKQSIQNQVPQPVLDPYPRRRRVKSDPIDVRSLPLLPTDWEVWSPFLERHGASSKRRPASYLNKSDYCQLGQYQKPQKQRRGSVLVRYVLDPAGQHRLLTKLRSMDSGLLSTCEITDCPCHEVFR